MRMDVRDFELWAAEAKHRVLWRRSEMYGAALLPNQREESIRRALDDLDGQLYVIENEDEIDGIEKEAKRRLDEVRAKLKKRRSKK